jgi:hypothetical protein
MGQPTFEIDLAGICPVVLKSAADLAKNNYAMALEKKNGTLDFLTDPSNGSVKADLSQKGKNIVRGKVVYKQPTKSCEILDGSDAQDTGICDEAIESEEKEVDVIIDDAVATKPRQFTAQKFHTICQDIPSFVKEYLDSDMRALRERTNEKALAKIAVDAGVKIRQNGDEVGQGLYTEVPLLHTVNGQSVPLIGNFQEQILLDYSNMKFTGTPALIGQGNLQTFLALADMACCNSSNISYENAIAKAGAAAFIDQSVNSTLGANKFLMAAFGASHLLWFNKNSVMGKPNTELVRHIVVPDPIYPQLKWDLDFKWDECDEVWVYQLSASFDVFNVFQFDSFADDSGAEATSPTCDDELLGVTGIWGYTATKTS